MEQIWGIENVLNAKIEAMGLSDATEEEKEDVKKFLRHEPVE
jgi:hypothetical protein